MTFSEIGKLHEQNANVVIAQWISDAGRNWRARGDRKQVLDGTNGRPDIVIRQAGRMPVIVECEYGRPAVRDANSRLGKRLVGETRLFTEVIAVGIDSECENGTEESLRRQLGPVDKPVSPD